MGTVSPLGLDTPSTWKAALAGESGIDFIRSFDASGFPVRVAAEVKDFEPPDVVSPKEARRLDRNVLLAVEAGRQALEDAGLDSHYETSRVGIAFGSAIGGFHGIMEQHEVLQERGPTRVSPHFLPSVLVDSASGQLAISLGLRGPNYAPVSACATGSHAVGEGAEIIRRGDADAMLAGGTEACMHPLILAGFCAMRGLAAEDEHPPRASRPFDATRAGFVIGEGAGALVLEELEAARARGATIYAEVLAYGTSNDAYHLAAPEPEGELADFLVYRPQPPRRRGLRILRGDGTYRVSGPLAFEGCPSSPADVRRGVQHLADLQEELVRAHPEQWLAFRDIWAPDAGVAAE
jgi:3-oxoacyl-[acyl-carrier-protein] synthase II